ncbi:MAG: cytochrome c [Pseudomonadota bacterium]
MFHRVLRVNRSIAFSGLLAILMMAASVAPVHSASDSAESSESGSSKPLADPTKAASNPLSDAGTSGFHLFRRHCQSCHGYLGMGTSKGGPLTRTRYSRDHKARRDFHRNFRSSTPKHARVARGTPKKPGPRFNDLELIGKFLREIEAWHMMLEANSTE